MKKLLDILRNIDKDILIITNKYNNQDYTKYQKQYNNITLKINNNIHDRFIIIDNKELYHIGASLKDLGNLEDHNTVILGSALEPKLYNVCKETSSYICFFIS